MMPRFPFVGPCRPKPHEVCGISHNCLFLLNNFVEYLYTGISYKLGVMRKALICKGSVNMARRLLLTCTHSPIIQKYIRDPSMKSIQKTFSRLAIGASIAATFIALPASATLITVTSFSQPGPTTVRIQSVAPATNLYVYAGGFNTTDGTNVFVSWCVDILQSTYLGQANNSYTLVDAASVSQIGAARADALARLATRHLSEVTNATTSAAFQLAAWEIVYENIGTGYNMGSGNFSAWGASDGSIALAQNWLSDMSGSSTYNVGVWQSPTRQDLAVFTPVPEPATLGLLAVGLIGLGIAKRKGGGANAA